MLSKPLTLMGKPYDELANQVFRIENFSKLPETDYLTGKSHHHYMMLNKTVRTFDSHFNNTAVDTLAFERVIKSPTFTRVIYCYMYIPEYQVANGLFGLRRSLAKYAIQEVKNQYSGSGHSVLEPKIFYDYMDKLINRLLILRHNALPLKNQVQTKIILEYINDMVIGI